MHRCLNLARLTKPPLYSHVHFCKPSPGSPNDLLIHRVGPGVLDPTHPAAKMPAKAFPSFKTESFRLVAFPSALLIPHPDSIGTPAKPSIDTWSGRKARAAELQRNHAESGVEANVLDRSRVVAPPVPLPHPRWSIPMLLYFSIGKAKTHKHAVKRRRLRSKFRGAIDLIVTRGAQTNEVVPGIPQLEFNDDEVQKRGDKWILPGWAYICYAHSPLYLIPYTKLIPQLRSSLEEIWVKGTRLEEHWVENEMRKQGGLHRTENEMRKQGGLRWVENELRKQGGPPRPVSPSEFKSNLKMAMSKHREQPKRSKPNFKKIPIRLQPAQHIASD